LLIKKGGVGHSARSTIKLVSNDYSLMAETGQVAMQAPQSMQVSSSTTALSFSIFSALTGHTSTQAPQPMQVSLSIFTAMRRLLLCFFPLSPSQDISQAFL
jgi:hypothetical protein